MRVSLIDFDKCITSYPNFLKPGILFPDIGPWRASAAGMNCTIDQTRCSDFKLRTRPCCRDSVVWVSVFWPARGTNLHWINDDAAIDWIQ